MIMKVFLPQTKLGHRGVRVRLRGLKYCSRYSLMIGEITINKSGAYLMNHGIDLRLSGDYQSEIIKITEV